MVVYEIKPKQRKFLHIVFENEELSFRRFKKDVD